MKLLTTMTAAALVMAATGCETDNTAYEMARARNLERHKQPFKPNFQPGTDMLGIPPTPVVYNPTPIQPAPAPSAVPVVVTSPGGGTTMMSQVGGTTVVSQFGGYRPIYTPPVIPINTGNNTPTVYTMPIQQP